MSAPARYLASAVAVSQTWRLRVHYRLLIIGIQALLPAAAASMFWVPWTTRTYVPRAVVWLLLAVGGAGFLVYAIRAWHESVTLTTDKLIVRNVFRSREIPLAHVTSVRFRRFGVGLAITSTSQGGGTIPGSGRHAGAPQAVAQALQIGAAFWTGRRTMADEAADAIAGAAGLPPLAARSEIISVRASVIMIGAGIAMAVLGAWVSGSADSSSALPSARQVLGAPFRLASFLLLIPAVMTAFDRLCGRWRR